VPELEPLLSHRRLWGVRSLHGLWAAV